MTTMLMPSVSKYMSTQPWTIECDASIHEASELMRKHQIRHLPVLEDGRLVGVVSERDLQLLDAADGPRARTVHVNEAMTERPCIVTGDTSLDEVATIMSEHKYGSVIVVGRNGVEGIFTSVDACRVLADVLQQHRLD
jgi:acetoin utilization protein AcuB